MSFDLDTDLKLNGWDSEMKKGMKRIKEWRIKERSEELPDTVSLSDVFII